MKIIKPSIEFWGEVPTDYDSAIRFIEKAGRTCYKSEDKITPDSAEKFVRKLIAAGHLAMVEHSNFVVRTRRDYALNTLRGLVGKFLTVVDLKDYTYIGGNLTAWFQLAIKLWPTIPPPVHLFCDLYFSLFGHNLDTGLVGPLGEWHPCPHNEIPKELRRYTVKFICDRGVSHELVRHRPCSFAQESKRYVNYGGKDMEFIEPAGFEDWTNDQQACFLDACRDAAAFYQDSIVFGLKPQQARAVLPNALKTEVVVTADPAEWRHIRALRTAPAAHPDMVRVMGLVPWEEII